MPSHRPSYGLDWTYTAWEGILHRSSPDMHFHRNIHTECGPAVMHFLVGYVFPPTPFHFVATHGPIPERYQLQYDWLFIKKKQNKKTGKQGNSHKYREKCPKCMQNSTETVQTAAQWRQIWLGSDQTERGMNSVWPWICCEMALGYNVFVITSVTTEHEPNVMQMLFH